MTTDEIVKLITAAGAIITPVMVAAFGALQHISSTRNHEQGKRNADAIEGVRETVNGPLKASLTQNVVLAKRVAEQSGMASDQQVHDDAKAALEQNLAASNIAKIESKL